MLFTYCPDFRRENKCALATNVFKLKHKIYFQAEVMGVGEEGRLRGHVWGSPVGADDDAAPPRSSSRHSHRMRGNLKRTTNQ